MLKKVWVQGEEKKKDEFLMRFGNCNSAILIVTGA